MAYVTELEIQQWLEATKLNVSSVDAQLELSARNIAFNKLSQIYDTTVWTNIATTPALIRQVISMLVAAWIYNRAFSQEDSEGSGYAAWLEDKAMGLLESISTGALDLPEVVGIVTSVSGPSFYPNDDTELEDPYQAAKFSMGKVF